MAGYQGNRYPRDQRDYYPSDSYRGGRGYSSGRGYDTDQGGRGGGGGRYYDDYQGGRGRGDGSRGGRGGRGLSRGGRQSWGRSDDRAARVPRQRDVLPDDVEFLVDLDGHPKTVTCMTFDLTTQQLYSGSKDGTVKVWSCVTGELASSVDVGGPVDSIFIGGGFLIVGMHTTSGEGIIKIWNMATAATQLLTGHKGAILALTVANNALFSGGSDHSIRVWTFNAAAGIFVTSAILTKAEGGHSDWVSALTSHGAYLFSGSRDGSIKIWDVTAGTCVQTIQKAHQDAVLQLIVWQTFLISGSLDGTVRCWSPEDPVRPGAVLNPTPQYTFTPSDNEPNEGSNYRRQRAANVPSGAPGVLCMAVVVDTQNRDVLMVSYNDAGVKLFELPSFESRGALTAVVDARGMAYVPETKVMVVGDISGKIKVFKWK